MRVPAEHYVEAGSVHTCYWVEGQGRPLLLVHGLGGSSAGWLPSIGALSARFRVYAPDLIGHGHTARPANARYDASEFDCFLLDFMHALGIERAHVAGHSLGGAIALRFALGHGAMVERLVLADSAGLGREMGPLFRLLTIPGLGEFLASRTYTPDVQEFGRRVRAASKNPSQISDELIGNLFRLEQLPEQYKVTLKVLRVGANLLGQSPAAYQPLLQGLRSLPNPTLIVWGRQDELVPFRHGEAAAKLAPDGQFKGIENCGHVPMFDQPDVLNSLLLEFLGA